VLGPTPRVSRVSPANTMRLTLAARVSFNSWLTMPGWLKLADDAFYLIGSAVFQCMEYHRNHESKTEDTLFLVFLTEDIFIFRCVSRANTADMVNMNAPSLVIPLQFLCIVMYGN
jgi:hypothetical protein